jgi:hypothetical protein
MAAHSEAEANPSWFTKAPPGRAGFFTRHHARFRIPGGFDHDHESHRVLSSSSWLREDRLSTLIRLGERVNVQFGHLQHRIHDSLGFFFVLVLQHAS